ncbi:MAG: RagB/SusD family nutrient uptake outer membrane protein [Bacteroidetes bacterium]|nr:RagB/SusD family nutrient uptake outer membrane protein [Bacteroidota bacterium]
MSILSCKDAIDIVQAGELNEATVFKTTSDLEKYLNGAIYAGLDNMNQIKFSAVFTDELSTAPTNTGWDYALHRYFLNSDDSYASGIWANNYATINKVNRLLKIAQTITPASTDIATYNNTLAEARVLRAYAYLTLQSYFTTNMKDDNALGVMLSTSVPEIYDQLPRVSNANIWAQIESDLAFADVNLNTSNAQVAPHPFPFFVSKSFVSALRARMYLYRGKYTQAKQYAQDAITTSGVNLTIATPIPTGTPGSPAWNNSFYSEATTNPYRKIWNDTSNGECIFVLNRPIGGVGGNVASLFTTNKTDIDGAVLWTVGLNLVSNFSSYTNDIRPFAFMDPKQWTGADAVYRVIDKYPGKGTQVLKNNLKIVRLSEMKLILAECAIREATPDYVTAANYIKEVRQARRYSGTVATPTYTSISSALQDVLKERRVELCFEGQRYIDLRRVGADAGVSIDRNAQDDIVATPLTLPITDYRFTLPIPTSEIAGNPTIVQNPGY